MATKIAIRAAGPSLALSLKKPTVALARVSSRSEVSEIALVKGRYLVRKTNKDLLSLRLAFGGNIKVSVDRGAGVEPLVEVIFVNSEAELPALAHPAIAFAPVPGYAGLYHEFINMPVP